MLTTNGDCDICGAAGGKCGDFISGLPLGVALEPKGNGQMKSGRFYRTTERVFRNGRLVVGIGVDMPWEQAIELGLVEAPPTEPTVLGIEPPTEVVEITEADIQESKPELVAAEDITAAIKRRPKNKPGARLKDAS